MQIAGCLHMQWLLFIDHAIPEGHLSASNLHPPICTERAPDEKKKVTKIDHLRSAAAINWWHSLTITISDQYFCLCPFWSFSASPCFLSQCKYIYEHRALHTQKIDTFIDNDGEKQLYRRHRPSAATLCSSSALD